jgi:hypothetical protein
MSQAYMDLDRDLHHSRVESSSLLRARALIFPARCQGQTFLVLEGICKFLKWLTDRRERTLLETFDRGR